MNAPDAVARFTGFADHYDRMRPEPPPELPDVLTQWADVSAPEVVDLGAGTGLSALLWSGRAARVTAVEPSADMRALAERRFAGLPEVARLLRPGGVFAAFDCDWPPCVDAETDTAYAAFEAAYRDVEVRRGVRPPHAAKAGHLGRMRESGLFRHTVEIALHKRDTGDAERLLGLALSQGGVVALLAAGTTEEEIGLTRLREVAARRLPEPRAWWWTYRVRLGVR
ncbi:class I SAM-dependent methyltransferase [Marinitenerispora sediminis]|uniref:Class I SAM-dependent methyltransferase n=1 Tax=Marinitenerispora sediminis TaxID=1931232 RepID=A0A368TA75_9ACTN|nr:class I SAM-dependent methyltransferase [Marinitenerispora sediminis]RCV53376.1 class I SAM-dependent methyltransferase [Marinitenerispora sediminis]RCV58427.1 class I SAM-dependent methyltransferase [Marinitenerispora sediminis]RCV61791.1 class I SAM-dependent methyltransferase [Marinitenerispora sediminis]